MPIATCFCGTCQRCYHRAYMRRRRAERAEMMQPWAKSVRKFTLEHLGYSQSALSQVAMSAKRLIAHSRRLRLRVFEVMPTEGGIC